MLTASTECACTLDHVWLFSDSIGCSPPGSSVHGISQARILEWVAISYSRGSSWPRDWTHVSGVSCIGRWTLYQLCHLEKQPGVEDRGQSSKKPSPQHHLSWSLYSFGETKRKRNNQKHSILNLRKKLLSKRDRSVSVGKAVQFYIWWVTKPSLGRDDIWAKESKTGRKQIYETKERVVQAKRNSKF